MTVLILVAIIVLSRIALILYAKPAFTEISKVHPAQVVLVPGAGLNRDGTPSLVLRDRLDAAIELYWAGKVQKILLSGDNSSMDYNEPASMSQYVSQSGIPASDIVLDYAGRRTYDSCLRAKQIFGVENLILVTQAYHLSRAIFLCQQQGLQVWGVAVRQSQYNLAPYLSWNIREIFASMAALWDVYIHPPQVILGIPEPIFTK